ncbi:gamma-glutamylcyclotransferase (GGCT)/AIG2-like uncharacterized protein YtfP [Ruminiclostridium sufflavum DSM 19573]|uniref:Gamma-glutamylcyclotransferase (GGCT)/AIG2-like uncharacterized protein YtfP n=1 Tax=Ruminiclostridium sufflavum DSM 19573 TaxID=1121337 RepID=A0A318XJR3_9FIRM|nr:gamma-glutamylcyclotransferase family protein [Ruminiclostridium sufflavum]PYG84796.1 gamma-glutamylcyclotransferase (GGCT)/AIG2-like uncharacterized protein YtfP [Ruminiclostridium sufflavum DSM 19573]
MINETKIYGAYGSNMNLKQMSHRCPNAKVIGTGKLKNYRLTFRGINNGVANIEKRQGSTVPIVLWEITAECEKALDIYEGYPKLYVKEEVEITTKDGTIKAMVYVMSKQYEQLLAEPSGHYINTIWQGYLDNKLPLIKLREAIAENRNETDTVSFFK